MPFQRLLQRWGFVKLDRYGLVLTGDGRVMTTRPAVLDDGAGGRIVGWQEGDPVMSELRTCEPRRAAPAVAAPIAPSPAARVVAESQAIPVVSASTSAAEPGEAGAVAGAVSAALSAAMTAVAVAPEPVVEEDDWEWTIALAKARAQADLAAAEPSGPTASVVSAPLPEPVVTVNPGLPDYSWVAAGTAETSKPAQLAAVVPRPGVPVTVIPVPTLPSVQGVTHTPRFVPVVRQVPVSAMNQLPGVAQSGAQVPRAEAAKPKAPKIELPAAARAVELPSQKRRNNMPR